RLDRATRRVLVATLLLGFPVLALVLLTLDPAVVMLIGSTGHLLTATLLRSPARLAPWIAAGVVGLLGFLFAAAERAHSPARAAVAVAACSAALQLVITQVVLPEFNVFCSARPWAEHLGRAARAGASVMTFGFSNREAVSPFLFYAGLRVPGVGVVAGERHVGSDRLAFLAILEVTTAPALELRSGGRPDGRGRALRGRLETRAWLPVGIEPAERVHVLAAEMLLQAGHDA